MAPQRSLLPPTHPSAIQPTSNVIGIVPPSIHSLLSTSSHLRGGIDPNSSGLSYIHSNNEIHVWEHSVQTLNEELVAPQTSLRLIHPHFEGDLKVACVRRKGVHHLYACSGGIICLWIIDARSGLALHRSKEEEGECDAFLSFELEDDEYVTCVTPVEEWILVATSRGNVYKVRMTSRPLGLHAKLISDMEEEGIVKGLYNRLFTPKKNEEVQEGIVAMFPFCKEREGRQGPSPRKMPRLSNGYMNLLSLSESLLLMEWKVSLLPEESVEGRLSKRRLFRCRADGTLDLDSLGDLEGYNSVELVDATSAKEHVLAVVRLSSRRAEDTRLYVIRIALSGEHALSIVDFVWLNRYCGEDITQGGALECFGCVAGDEEGVVYVGFGGRESECPVTISAIHFGEEVRMKDMDLFHHMVPSVVSGCMDYDSTTGGCVFLATSGLLGGASVRFPRALQRAREEILDVSRDESVSAIKSHLLSAFRQYANKLRDGSGTNHASVARAVMPPSINGCSASVLTAAAVMASEEFLTNSSGERGGWLSPSFKKHSSVAVLREKLQLHANFVNFLLHAGAFRKVTPAGRVKLRDHGEMIVATQASFTECQEFLTKLDDSAVDGTRKEEVASIRKLATRAFENVSDSVVDLPSCWAGLQLAYTNDNNDLIWLTSLIICNGIGRALRYRQDESSLYDVPVYEMSAESSSAPWTSSSSVLQVLQVQLQNINQSGDALLDNSADLDADNIALRQLVEDMSAALLGGHRDIVMRDIDNKAECQIYEDAKQLAIPLLRRFANDGGDDIVALSTSLAHEHFQGIVQICHDHRKSWMHRGPFSDKAPDETYDLRLMLQSSNESPYTYLHNSVDFSTGLDFCSFVLGWYASEGLKSKVLELGKECPGALAQHLHNDHSMSELSWINDVRSGSYENATNGLLNSSSDDLWEKETNLSFAKLANKLALSTPNTAREMSRTATIEDGLLLTSVQRCLHAEELDQSVMSAGELISLAVNKVKSTADTEARKSYVTCGLQAASTMSSSKRNDSLSGATAVWEAAIQSDMQLWKSLAQQSSMSVSGIPDNVLTQCGETVFVGVCVDLATNAKMESVGFLTNPSMRQRVGQTLGLDENLEKLLVYSAQVACNYS